MSTTYPVTCPPQSPPVMSLTPGDMLGDLPVTAVAPADQHDVYHCSQCGKAFNNGQAAVIVNESGTLQGMHKSCAESYRRRCVPLVVTVHADGTASVTGPCDPFDEPSTVTIVVEPPTLVVATLCYGKNEDLFTTAGNTEAEALDLMRNEWALFQSRTVDGIATESFESLRDKIEIRVMRPGYASSECV